MCLRFEFFSGRRGAADFGLDSESDACIGFDLEPDGFCRDFDVGSESVVLDLDWDREDLFSGGSDTADFGLDSESDACLDLD
jgi:hypothetical protein